MLNYGFFSGIHHSFIELRCIDTYLDLPEIKKSELDVSKMKAIFVEAVKDLIKYIRIGLQPQLIYDGS